MTNQQELVRQITGKNRLSNIMLCCKIIFDLIPQVLLIHMVGLYFAASLTRGRIFRECGVMLICFIEKAVSWFLSGTKDGRSDKRCAARRGTGGGVSCSWPAGNYVCNHSSGRCFPRHVVGRLASGSRNDHRASADVGHEKNLCPALDKKL